MINRFFVTNYDEDHISDIESLQHKIRILHRNKSISPDQLRGLKEETGPVSPAMEALLGMMTRYIFGEPDPPPEFPGISYNTFYHNYPSDFEDTNNLSFVTFVDLPIGNFVIPGDLEEQGWRLHLQDSNFQDCLRRVNVFVASHHGRESGYCEDVFTYCRPEVVVFSDGPITYATQEEAQKYAQHAEGVDFEGRRRKVLTTRQDGSLRWAS